MTDAQRQMTVRRAVLRTIFIGSGAGAALLVLVLAVALLVNVPGPEELVLAGVAFIAGPTAVAGVQVSQIRASMARSQALAGSPHSHGG
jgi:hypothetical protein